PIPESALQTFCASPGRPSGRSRAGFLECSIPRPATFREAACARPAAPGSPAIQSTWRAPAGTIPSAAAGQAHTHPCGPSSPSSPTMPPSHAASPAERFEILLASARHAAIVITALPQAQSDSPERQVLSRNKQRLPARSRPSPPSRSCPAHPQRKRSSVPKRRRFRHSVPRLSSISDAWGRLNVVTPFHHLPGDSHLHRSLGARPITASSKWRPISSKLMTCWLYFKYGSLKCRRCADAIYASQTCSKRLRPILQAQRAHLFLKLKTGMWKRTRHRPKARITTAVRQELKSKRLAHHSIQIPPTITALAVLCIGVRPRMRWRSCHV